MPNMKAIILKKETFEQSKPCNCRNKDVCPLKGSCRKQSIIYQADIPCKHYAVEFACNGTFKGLQKIDVIDELT